MAFVNNFQVLTGAWAAMKLLDKALTLSTVGEPPTSAAILEGLYKIQDEDLGGLTVPLSFARGKFVNPPLCWWNITVIDGEWATPDGFKRNCDS